MNARLNPKPISKSEDVELTQVRPANAPKPRVPSLPGDPGRSDHVGGSSTAQRPRFHLKNSLRYVLADARRARATVERIVTIVDGIENDVNTLLTSLDGNPAASPDSEVGIEGPAADFVCIKRHADDSVSVQIDDFPLLRLPAYLGRFFLLLLSRTGQDEDGLIPWKSRDALARLLAEKMQRQVRPQYINKLVNDMRYRLEKAGLGRRLIQTHDLKGVRFAQRSTGITKRWPQTNVREISPGDS